MKLQEARTIVIDHDRLLGLIREAEGRIRICKTSIGAHDEAIKKHPSFPSDITEVEKAIIIKSQVIWEEAAANWRNQAKEIEDNF